jgi:hypothetical protein
VMLLFLLPVDNGPRRVGIHPLDFHVCWSHVLLMPRQLKFNLVRSLAVPGSVEGARQRSKEGCCGAGGDLLIAGV